MGGVADFEIKLLSERLTGSSPLVSLIRVQKSGSGKGNIMSKMMSYGKKIVSLKWQKLMAEEIAVIFAGFPLFDGRNQIYQPF